MDDSTQGGCEDPTGSDGSKSIGLLPSTAEAMGVSIPSGNGSTKADCSCGLADEGFALCHQITTLDRSKLTEHVGSLRPAKLAEVEEGISAALAIDRQRFEQGLSAP